MSLTWLFIGFGSARNSWARRVVLWLVGARDPSLAEGLGEGVAEPFVVGLQFTDALCGDLDTAEQGSVGGALAVRDGAIGGRERPVAQPRRLGPKVGLAVDP